MRLKIATVSFISLLSASICIDSASAAIIGISDIELLSGDYTGETDLTRLIDGSGLSDTSPPSADFSTVTHNSTSANQARLFTSPTAQVRLTLSSISKIDSAFFWNGFTSASNDIQSVRYEFLDSGLTTIFDSGNVAIPGPLGDFEVASVEYAAPSTISSVQFVDVTFTRRAGGSSFAPGEIRFTNVPEPFTILGTVAALGIGVKMKKYKQSVK